MLLVCRSDLGENFKDRPVNATSIDLRHIIIFIHGFAIMLVYLIAASSFLYFSGAAVNVLLLQNKKFTHILNVAMGKSRFHSNTNHVMYRKVGIKFLGKSQIGLILN